MTKLRVVRHGSYCTANTSSINQWIDQRKCQMPTLPNLKDYVRLLIDSKWMALRDLSDAFRQIGLASADIGYLVHHIDYQIHASFLLLLFYFPLRVKNHRYVQ